jgi:hypothetical protein
MIMLLVMLPLAAANITLCIHLLIKDARENGDW